MRSGRTVRRFAAGALLLVGLMVSGLGVACSGDTKQGAVHILTADTEVGPVMEQYIDRGITRAEDNNAKLVIIQLDTPGGLSESMRAIVQRIERAKVPVVVYVSPTGARAASAGTFITMAANVAAMAPNSSIGAAAAVNSDGSDIGGTLGKKVENDSVSFIRGIAELRGRNADWAEQAVRDAISSNQTEAVNQDVVNFEANDLDQLLHILEGEPPPLGKAPDPAYTGIVDAPRVYTDMTLWEKLLNFIADPTLASILITLGFFGLMFELWNPGLVFPGVVGVICMVLGFIGLGTLPINEAGLVLIALGLAFFAIELFVASGILGVGGVVCIILGAIIAFRGTSAAVQPSKVVYGVLALFLVGLSISVATGVARVRRLAAPMGTNALLGKMAVARTPLTPEGYVFVQGERWKARMDRGFAQQGESVRIVGAQGFQLSVHKEDEA
jgi:membrane-bound serine protease (ClpP class)